MFCDYCFFMYIFGSLKGYNGDRVDDTGCADTVAMVLLRIFLLGNVP